MVGQKLEDDPNMVLVLGACGSSYSTECPDVEQTSQLGECTVVMKGYINSDGSCDG